MHNICTLFSMIRDSTLLRCVLLQVSYLAWPIRNTCMCDSAQQTARLTFTTVTKSIYGSNHKRSQENFSVCKRGNILSTRRLPRPPHTLLLHFRSPHLITETFQLDMISGLLTRCPAGIQLKQQVPPSCRGLLFFFFFPQKLKANSEL